MNLHNLVISLYLACALFLAIYTTSHLVILLLYFVHRRRQIPLPSVKHWPGVVVQLPLYNERPVVHRLLEAAAALDYPRDRLLIQVLDDSTDDTPALVAEIAERLRATGVNIQHVRRPQRIGYKAGALAYGLGLLPPGYTLAAVFDADFVPPPDFLRRTVPYFSANPRLGIVQTRWGHLNADDNLLTRAQSLNLDAHFAVEQVARNRSGLLLTFNGSGGVWRVRCVKDAGGWSADTLCEDLDLSYRAQLKGWQYLFLPDVVVPAELPPNLAAYKTQQFRWAKGCNQALMKLAGPIWRGRLTLAQRVMATQHLMQYLPHVAMLTMLLLTPPLMVMGVFRQLPLAPLSILGVAPLLVYAVAQAALYDDWPRRLLAWLIVLIIGTGIAVNNTHAALSAFAGRLTGRYSEFVRTPKFGGQAGAYSTYRPRISGAVWFELALMVYALFGVLVARRYFPALASAMMLYAVSFGAVALISLREVYLARLHERTATVAAEVNSRS